MGNRRKARMLAVQALFCMDIRKDFSLVHLRELYRFLMPSKASAAFFIQLVKGVMRAGSKLDGIVESFSSNWKISRMNCADRNILRLAVFELLYCENIPDKVAINEAIDLGKKFGADESGAFINGILDSIRIARVEGALVPPPLAPAAELAARRLRSDPPGFDPPRARPFSAPSPQAQPAPAATDASSHPLLSAAAGANGSEPVRKPRRIVVRPAR